MKLKYPSESYTLIPLERSSEDSVQLSKKSLELLSIAHERKVTRIIDKFKSRMILSYNKTHNATALYTTNTGSPNFMKSLLV